MPSARIALDGHCVTDVMTTQKHSAAMEEDGYQRREASIAQHLQRFHNLLSETRQRACLSFHLEGFRSYKMSVEQKLIVP